MSPSSSSKPSLGQVQEALRRAQALKAYAALQARLKQAQQANTQLREAASKQLAAERERSERSKLAAELAAELELLQLSQHNLTALPMSGPPDWSGRSDKWGPWVTATEFIYSLQPPVRGRAAGNNFSTDGQERASPAKAAFKLDTTPTVYVREREVRLQICKGHFSKGGTRLAYYARSDDGGQFVVKAPIHLHQPLEEQLADAYMDAAMQAIAQRIAAAFTCAQFAGSSSTAAVAASYHAASVVLVPGHWGIGSRPGVMLKEQHIPGKFTKWVKNDGTILQTCEEVEALAHFSLEFSLNHLGAEAMLLDLQGCCCRDSSAGEAPAAGSSSGAGKVYRLSDPVLCSAKCSYGRMDHGAEAIVKFKQQHVCSELCRAVRSMAWLVG